MRCPNTTFYLCQFAQEAKALNEKSTPKTVNTDLCCANLLVATVVSFLFFQRVLDT